MDSSYYSDMDCRLALFYFLRKIFTFLIIYMAVLYQPSRYYKCLGLSQAAIFTIHASPFNTMLLSSLTEEEQTLHAYAALVQKHLEAYHMSASRDGANWKNIFEDHLVSWYSSN
jgi:hypothetical protein